MRISDVTVSQVGGGTELKGKVGEFDLFYRFPLGFRVLPRGDAFLAAALFPSMRLGSPLQIDSAFPVSPRLLAVTDTIQDIFTSWYPYLQKVPVRASPDPAEPVNPGVASFFSGGVDGSYTFLRNEGEITHLLFARGIDMQLSNGTLFAQSLKANRGFLESRGKCLIPVETNVRFLGHSVPPLNWIVCHGAGLASIALALGFQKTYVAASHSYGELVPWGSHPLTDSLWSTEGTEIVHSGAEARRSQKLQRIGKCPEALSILRVCWQDAGYNCGRCEKCLRTMIGLRALRLCAPTFPTLDIRGVSRLRIADDNELSFFIDSLDRATSCGDRLLRRALAKCISSYHRRKVLGELDRVFLGSRLGRLFRRSG